MALLPYPRASRGFLNMSLENDFSLFFFSFWDLFQYIYYLEYVNFQFRNIKLSWRSGFIFEDWSKLWTKPRQCFYIVPRSLDYMLFKVWTLSNEAQSLFLLKTVPEDIKRTENYHDIVTSRETFDFSKKKRINGCQVDFPGHFLMWP